jgi:hypothetical protein
MFTTESRRVRGEYHWYQHDDDGEFFYVVEGRLLIDLAERTEMLMVENAGIVSTGS